MELKNLRLCEAGIQYSRYKDHIIYRLEGAGDPSVPFLDLSLTFWVYQEGEDGRVLEFPIGSQCMEEWGISTETLAEWAKVNTPRLLPAQVVGMSELMGGARIRKDGKEREMVYFLTNRTGRFGAAVITYEGILKELADHLEADLFLLPLSVHQVLAVPDEKGVDPKALLGIPLADQGLTEAERLPLRVYHYSRKTEELGPAAQA